ncbi:hypothetical protein Acr_03g0013440 [Actinidia rufa]|uniref:Uncharacterized protein n=1 Tax=Actinidia rufa TaxID=165716 RepID=A0A7J0EDX2_9ERIC|nr:hypothetical protein Acr_03g0013440 [Actinidia rufa]
MAMIILVTVVVLIVEVMIRGSWSWSSILHSLQSGLRGCLAAHQSTLVPKTDVVIISADEYQRLLTAQSSPATVTLAQTSASTACSTSTVLESLILVPPLT